MVNRLAREASPYLRQHGENPVDWYPWGPEALAKAKREDKPILVSIGYSACHWCHVMERESFANDAIARQMNESFVNVKVDREERPDLDQVYQLVVQLMGRNGGWPLTVFLTPEQRPFFGGTYFPPADRYGMPGFPKVLEAVAEAYRLRREDVDQQAAELTRAIAGVGRAESDGLVGGRSAADDLVGGRSAADASSGGRIDAQAVAKATVKVAGRFDDERGGFGGRPKFPNTLALELLLRAGDRVRVRKALDAMLAGGIWDQLGGGFHRYSTDERWLVPHFEKMLYDNALLMRLYADAWRATGEAAYERTARAIAEYVAREMTSPEGGFYATQDADSDGEEGKFFVWTVAEIDAALADDPEAARVAKVAFDVDDQGNFEGGPASVLSMPAPIDDVAKALGMARDDASAALERARTRLLVARSRRVWPFRDEKILASWNGLMAGALASAGAAFGAGELVASGARALSFVERELVRWEDGERARVLRHVKDGVARGPGFLDDHAFVGDGALDLYEATGDPAWVRLARGTADAILAHFYDAAESTMYFTPDDGERILVRPVDSFDHAVPSAGAVAARLLLRLGALADAKYSGIGARVVERMAPAAFDNPLGMSVTVALADRLVRGGVDIVLVGPRDGAVLRDMAGAVQRTYVPDRTLAWADPTDPASTRASAVLSEGKPAHGEAAAYVCRGRSCSRALASAEELAAELGA
jgi:uncharacterized protein YyaL (SSP411 family)